MAKIYDSECGQGLGNDSEEEAFFSVIYQTFNLQLRILDVVDSGDKGCGGFILFVLCPFYGGG